MRSVSIVLAVLFVLSIVPLGSTQAQPDADRPTLWAHGEVDDDGERLWMNADKGDSRATDTANGPGYCPGPFDEGVPVGGQPGCDVASTAGAAQRPPGDFDHTFSLAMEPGLTGDVELDAEDVVAFTVYLGANSGDCEGDFVARLLTGETVAAETDAVPFSFDSGYVGFDAEAAVQEPVLVGGEALVWEIEVTCSGTGLFLGIHDDNGKSSLRLPVVGGGDGGGAEPVPRNLTGETAAIDLEAPGSSNVTHAFTWVNATANATLDYAANVTNGSATLRILDGAGEGLLEAELAGNVTGNETFTGAVPGNWSIEVVFTEFQGTLQVSLVAGHAGNATDDGGGGDAPGDEGPSDEDGGFLGIPGPQIVAVLAVLAAAAVLVRRR